MFCKEIGLAAYLSIKLVAKTSSSSLCNCASCDCGLGRLTCSSFILVVTNTTFLLFFIIHIDNTCIADSGAPNICLPRNSFLIFIYFCSDSIILAFFCHSFQCFTHSLITFSHIAADIFYCGNFINYKLQVYISSSQR